VFFITEGEVRVTIYSLSGEVVNFTELGAGDVFGEYAAIDGDLRSASVEARSHCLLASMSAAAFLHLLQAQPTVTQALLRKLVRNIRALDRRVYEFSTLAVNYRVQAEVLRIANLAPREGKSAHIVPAHPPQRFQAQCPGSRNFLVEAPPDSAQNCLCHSRLNPTGRKQPGIRDEFDPQ
jgi:CRP/FNR family cyclic AMP-dependent transcriptional regulator